MASLGLIGEDCAVLFEFGTRAAATGIITWPGVFTAISGIAKTIDLSDKVDKVLTSAMGDNRKRYRASKGESTLKIDTVVQVTGWVFPNAGVTPIGLPCRVEIKSNSTLAAFSVFTGMVETWHISIKDGEVQMEDITIVCDVDGT